MVGHPSPLHKGQRKWLTGDCSPTHSCKPKLENWPCAMPAVINYPRIASLFVRIFFHLSICIRDGAFSLPYSKLVYQCFRVRFMIWWTKSFSPHHLAKEMMCLTSFIEPFPELPSTYSRTFRRQIAPVCSLNCMTISNIIAKCPATSI